MYGAMRVKFASGAALNAVIDPATVCGSETNADFTEAKVLMSALLFAILASLTTLLYAPTAKVARSPMTVMVTISTQRW